MLRSTISIGGFIASLLGCIGPAAAQLVVPVNATCISSAYGPRILPNLPEAGTYHNGVDLPARIGTPVYATAAGQLIRIQSTGPGGLEMLIQHGGFIGVYSHLGSTTLIGSSVAAGQQIGVVGATGVSLGPHLFFGMLFDGHQSVDPRPFLDLPLCGGQKAPGQRVAEIWIVEKDFAASKRYRIALPVQ